MKYQYKEFSTPRNRQQTEETKYIDSKAATRRGRVV